MKISQQFSFPVLQVQKRLNDENTQLKQQIEQERRDHELALRLAHESNSSIEDLNTPQVKLIAHDVKSKKVTSDLAKFLVHWLSDIVITSGQVTLI